MRIPDPWRKCPNSWDNTPVSSRRLIPATNGNPIVITAP